MHKLPDRVLRGNSAKRHGVVLDLPNLGQDILHHVYVLQEDCLYFLTKEVQRRAVSEIGRGRPNDVHRKIDEHLKIGDYIYFKYDERNKYIVDYERGTNVEEVFIRKGKPLFKSQCVFNPHLSQVYTEHFGVLETSKEVCNKLGVVPTPNVAIFCDLGYEITKQKTVKAYVHSIDEVNGEDQSLVLKPTWNANWFRGRMNPDPYASDDDVQLEEDLKQNVGAMTKQLALITGLTSVYLTDQPTVTAILPTHQPADHPLGHEATVDLIFNDVHRCFVVFARKQRHSAYYRTHYSQQTSGDIDAKFYVDVYASESTSGFYKHSHLNLIADPRGFLSIAHVCNTQFGRPLEPHEVHFRVPVIDRLGGRFESRQMADLSLVTRFEVAGPVDTDKQYEVMLGIRNWQIPHEVKGVVVDQHEGFVYSPIYHTAIFQLPDGHSYRTGDELRFRCTRIIDPEETIAVFDIHMHHCELTGQRVEYDRHNGQFLLAASFKDLQNCYFSRYFGFIPSGDENPPSRPKFADDRRPFIIRAERNRDIGAQTILHRGKFVKANMPDRMPHH
ncbi:hypothetical protein M3Y99_00970800 [Aphelenchoides fujianensis]|nr:hypothetical protein M3Y99_00970800 [Aphelenchoides fujianensis]